MKTLFITMGDITWGSSRYRCYWPAKYMTDATVLRKQPGEEVPEDYDVYIWQKVADLEIVEQIANDGKRQYWDLCDPVHWWQPTEARFIADRCNAMVCSSWQLAREFEEWYGQDKVYCIPDRFELSHYIGGRSEHHHANPVRFIWYGIANNRFALLGALANLERLAANGVNLTLTICDDQPNMQWSVTNAFPIYFTRWSLDTEVKTIAAHDIAILPPYPGPWGRVKSDNKKNTAILCGIPWHDGQDYHDLYELATSAELREDRSADGLQDCTMESKCNVKLSALEWEELINGLAKV